jgi:hypothetical protein
MECGWLVYGVLCHFQQYFSVILAVSFIGGGNNFTFHLVADNTDNI